MAIQWTTDLATGIIEIDRQHQELYAGINNLLEACQQGKGQEAVAELIKFLEDYVIDHFGAEEGYMRTFRYPEYESHKAEHQQFIRNFSELKQEYLANGALPQLTIQTNRVVVNWLNNHIRKLDKALGAFLKTKMS